MSAQKRNEGNMGEKKGDEMVDSKEVTFVEDFEDKNQVLDAYHGRSSLP